MRKPSLQQQQVRRVLLEGNKYLLCVYRKQVQSGPEICKQVRILYLKCRYWAVAVGQFDGIGRPVLGVSAQIVEEVDQTGSGTFVAWEETAVVASEVVPLVESAYRSRLQF